MTAKLGAIARRFMAVFVVSFIPLVSVALNTIDADVPDYAAFYAAALAAGFASLAAGLKALQEFVPLFNIGALLGLGVVAAAYVNAFAQGFLSALIIGLSGWFERADFSTWHAALIGIVVGALTVGWRAVEGLLTKGQKPRPDVGV